MTQSKPIASLGPVLLARKGGARPVSQSQLDAISFEPAENENDAHLIAEAVAREPVQLVTRIGKRSSGTRVAVPSGKRTAFTLRLDEERHLKLKLASTVTGVSAQQLVTEALDQMLAGMPEIETLAARAKRGSKSA